MDPARIVIGVDTHRDLNVAVALDEQGHFLGSTVVATTQAGHAELLIWARRHGRIAQVGVEGTGSYGAGLTRFLRAAGIAVLEVERPERRKRSGVGKSDALDAERAARAVLSGTVRVQPKGGDGVVESLRVLWAVRRGAVKARTQAANQLHSLVVTAPDSLRHQLRALTCTQLVERAVRWRVGSASDPTLASRLAIRSVARRHQELTAEVKLLDHQIRTLVGTLAPQLVALPGSATRPPRRSWSPPATTPTAWSQRPRSLSFAEWLQSRRAPAGPSGTDSTVLATARPTEPFS